MIRPQQFLNPSQHSFSKAGLGRFSTSQGFTLIELMIALALGLLIVAAGLSIFLSSQRSLGLQSGMSELQQNANFGLSLLTHDLRHTNLNTVSSQRVNSFTTGSGIIFKKENLPSDLHTITDLETKYVTLVDQDADSSTGKSDRLTIQYVPATDRIFNCEGTEITSASSKVIVQRYYIAQTPQQVSGEPTAYSLYCDAAYYEKSATGPEDDEGNPTSIDVMVGLDTAAQQIMQRVDAFKVRLGVKNPAGHLRYMTISQYNTAMTALLSATACDTAAKKATTACTDTFLNVVSIEVGILSRSTGSIGSEANLNNKVTFKLAGADVTLNGADGKDVLNKKYLRQPVNQVVAIRNTLGAS